MYGLAQRQAALTRWKAFGMGYLNRRLVFVVAGLSLVSSCSNSDGGEVVEATPTTEASTTTAAPTTVEATTTTLSEREVAQAALESAEVEIEAAIQFWWTYPRDTALGDEGFALEILVDPIRQRNLDLAAARTAAGEIQRSRGSARIEVLDIRVDMETGLADVDVCSMGDDVLVDAESREELAADDGDSWEGQVHAALVDGVWKLEDFFTDEENGGNQCVFSD